MGQEENEYGPGFEKEEFDSFDAWGIESGGKVVSWIGSDFYSKSETETVNICVGCKNET